MRVDQGKSGGGGGIEKQKREIRRKDQTQELKMSNGEKKFVCGWEDKRRVPKFPHNFNLE